MFNFLEVKRRRISSDPGSRASVNVETLSGKQLKNKDDDREVRFKRLQTQIPLNISDSKYCSKHNYASVQSSKFITAHHFLKKLVSRASTWVSLYTKGNNVV